MPAKCFNLTLLYDVFLYEYKELFKIHQSFRMDQPLLFDQLEIKILTIAIDCLPISF